MPDEAIEVYSAQRSIILKGRATNVLAMNAAVRIAEGYLAQIQTAKKAQQFEQETVSKREDKSVGTVINLIEIAGSQQVMLSVKVAEIQRTELKRLNCQLQGAVWSGDGRIRRTSINGGGTMDGPAVTSCRTRSDHQPGLLRRVHRRQLQVHDGARRRQGERPGEDPRRADARDAHRPGGRVPLRRRVPDAGPTGRAIGAVTIEFKPYGVGLKFLPVVLSDGRINLKVNVSVSELAGQGSADPAGRERLAQDLRAVAQAA